MEFFDLEGKNTIAGRATFQKRTSSWCHAEWAEIRCSTSTPTSTKATLQILK